MAKIFKPPAQGSAYATPDGSCVVCVEYVLGPDDIALCPHGASYNQTSCVRGPGKIRYHRGTEDFILEILEGCRVEKFTRLLP